MKSNKKLVFICSTIIVLGVIYLVSSGKLAFNVKSGNTNISVNSGDTAVKVQELKILNTILKDVSSASATVEWTTSVPSYGQVLYGTTPASKFLMGETYASSSPIETNLDTAHNAVLQNLEPSTRIFYQIVSTNEKGEKIPGVERSFNTKAVSTAKAATTTQATTNPTTGVKKTTPKTTTTTPTPKTIPTPASLGISSISTKDITSSSATIEWKTNIGATSQILYGTTSEIYPLSSAVDYKLNTTHSVTLSGLVTNKKFYYQVVSIDAKGNKVLSKENSFQVATITISTAPKVEFSSAGGVSKISISWKTNVPTVGQVNYSNVSSSSGSYSNSFPTDSNLVTSHVVVTNNNLMSNTKFYYRIISTDAVGTKAISSEYSFITSSSSNTSETVSSTSVTIKWTTPVPTTAKVIFGTISGSYPLSSTLNSSLATSHTVTISGLQPKTTYYYQTVSTGSGVTNANGEERSFTTL